MQNTCFLFSLSSLNVLYIYYVQCNVPISFFFPGKEPDIEISQGSYPFWVEQTNTKRKVPVVQAFHLTKYLGKLWLEFDEEGELIKSYGNPVLLDSSIEQGI